MYRNALDFLEEDQKARFIVKNPVQKGFVAFQRIFWVSQAVMPSWGAGEARLRSAHTRRSLLQLLRGKSPCLWAESASRRLRVASFDMCDEASGLAAVASWCLLQHHSHAVSALFGHQPNGAHSLHASLPRENSRIVEGQCGTHVS